MTRQIQLIFLALISISFFICTNAHAELNKDPKAFLNGLATKVRHSVRSLGSINVLSVVRGTVTLIAPRKLSCLVGSIASVYQGNASNLRKRKVFKVSGTNDGQFISLEGRGGAGQGYEIPSLDAPQPLSFRPAGRKPLKESGDLGSIRVSFTDDFGNVNEIDFDQGEYVVNRTKNAATYKGTFEKRISRRCGVAKGRFNLKLTRR